MEQARQAQSTLPAAHQHQDQTVASAASLPRALPAKALPAAQAAQTRPSAQDDASQADLQRQGRSSGEPFALSPPPPLLPARQQPQQQAAHELQQQAAHELQQRQRRRSACGAGSPLNTPFSGFKRRLDRVSDSASGADDLQPGWGQHEDGSSAGGGDGEDDQDVEEGALHGLDEIESAEALAREASTVAVDKFWAYLQDNLGFGPLFPEAADAGAVAAGRSRSLGRSFSSTGMLERGGLPSMMLSRMQSDGGCRPGEPRDAGAASEGCPSPRRLPGSRSPSPSHSAGPSLEPAQRHLFASRKSTGLVYDERCLLHKHPGGPHPERPARVLSIMHTLESSGLASRMQRVAAKRIRRADVLRVHSGEHMEGVESLRDAERREQAQLKLGTESAFANEHSTDAALVSAGGVLQLVKAVCAGEVRNGIAVVRPPGHHAEECCVKGFCLFNNVAVAAAWASRRTSADMAADAAADRQEQELERERRSDPLEEQDSGRNGPCTDDGSEPAAMGLPSSDFKKFKSSHPTTDRGGRDRPRGSGGGTGRAPRAARPNYRPILHRARVLIVDFDVHHGNGTQNMFYEDPNVLFFSVHRYDQATFYPGGTEGSPASVGEGRGLGYNINVGWNGGMPGDADYLAVWRHVLMPAALQFNPDLVLVSAGFDAAEGDPLGGCRVTPAGYGAMLHQLMGLADGRVVVALEGGYDLSALAESSLVCAAVLLGCRPPRLRALPKLCDDDDDDDDESAVAAAADDEDPPSAQRAGRDDDNSSSCCTTAPPVTNSTGSTDIIDSIQPSRSGTRGLLPPSMVCINAINATVRAHKAAYWFASQTQPLPANAVLRWVQSALDFAHYGSEHADHHQAHVFGGAGDNDEGILNDRLLQTDPELLDAFAASQQHHHHQHQPTTPRPRGTTTPVRSRRLSSPTSVSSVEQAAVAAAAATAASEL